MTIKQNSAKRAPKVDFKRLICDEEGSAILEAVIVIAVVIAIALLFNTQIREFAQKLFTSVFQNNSLLQELR